MTYDIYQKQGDTWKKITEQKIVCPFPVGSIYISVGDTDPSTYWAGTTWSKLSDGTFLMGSPNGGKTEVKAELPNIGGGLGYYYGTTEQAHGCFEDSSHGTAWLKPMTEEGSVGLNNWAQMNASKGQTKVGGGYEKPENSVYKDGGKVIPSGTIAVCMWERLT